MYIIHILLKIWVRKSLNRYNIIKVWYFGSTYIIHFNFQISEKDEKNKYYTQYTTCKLGSELNIKMDRIEMTD